MKRLMPLYSFLILMAGFSLFATNAFCQEPAYDNSELSQAKNVRIASFPDDMFIDVNVPVHQIYVGETIRAEYDVYVSSRRGQVYYDVEEPEFVKWYSIEAKAPPASLASFDSISYTKEPHAVYYITPMVVGKLPLPALKVQVPYLSNNPWITHDTHIVEVIPLPEPQPAGFHYGNVGTFEIKASISSKTVHVGDVIVIDVKISGTAPVTGIGLAPHSLSRSAEGFKAYPVHNYDMDERIENDHVLSTRSYRVKLLALTPGEWFIPPFEVVSFDPKIHQYRTYQSESFTIDVEESGREISIENPRAKTVTLDSVQLRDIALSNGIVRKPISFLWLILPPGLAIFIYLIIYIKKRQQAFSQRKAVREECGILLQSLKAANSSDAQLQTLRELLKVGFQIDYTNSEQEMSERLRSVFSESETKVIWDIIRELRMTTYSTQKPISSEQIAPMIEILITRLNAEKRI